MQRKNRRTNKFGQIFITNIILYKYSDKYLNLTK